MNALSLLQRPAIFGALRGKLSDYGIHVEALINEDRYIPVDADEIPAMFMVDGWLDEERFIRTVSLLLRRGTGKNRRVRAFGEMVAILWAQGFIGATVDLEHLWNKFCAQHECSLLCLSKNRLYARYQCVDHNHLCCHSKMIDGVRSQLKEVVCAQLPHKAAV